MCELSSKTDNPEENKCHQEWVIILSNHIDSVVNDNRVLTFVLNEFLSGALSQTILGFINYVTWHMNFHSRAIEGAFYFFKTHMLHNPLGRFERAI